MKERTESKEKSDGQLIFENIESASQNGHGPISLKNSRAGLGLEDHIRYFLEFKKSLLALAFLVPVISFTIFQNKDYRAKASFKVEPGQDLTSNILSESLIGVKAPQNQLGDISERALVKAQSQNFYDELATLVSIKPEYALTKFKLGTERKAWVELLKKVFSGNKENENGQEVLARISEHLENIISVDKSGDHKISFTVSTKNHDLSANVQKLLMKEAAPILIKEPVREATVALKILEETEATLFLELDNLGEEILTLQKRHNTLMAQELPARYATMRLELEKNLLESQIEEKSLQRSIATAKEKLKFAGGSDYGAMRELDQLKAKVASVASSRALLEKKIKGLNGQYKNLPIFNSEIEKINLRKKIRLEKIHKLTEQMSLAKITLEKVKSAINYLDHNEKITETGLLRVMAKTFFFSLFAFVSYLAGLYYFNALFPKIMTKDELDQAHMPMTGILPKENIRPVEFKSKDKTSPRFLALANFYDRRVSGRKSFTIASVSGGKSHKNDALDLIGYCLGKGRKTYVYSPFKAGIKSKDFNGLKKVFGEKLVVVEGKQKLGTMVKLNEVESFIKERSKDELVFILGPGLEDSPNSILISQLTQKTFVFTGLFKSSALSVSKFLTRRSRLPAELKSKFYFTLTNTRPYDDIGTYIQHSKGLKDKANELELVHSKAG